MTTDATKQSLYDEVTQALDDYRLELADILDHVSDEQEIQSYGRKADQLHDLRCRWLRHTKDQDHNEYTISIRDQDGKLRDDYDLVCALLEAHDIDAGPLYRDPTDPAGHFRISITEKQTDDITEEDTWAESEPFVIEVHGPLAQIDTP